MRYLLAMPAGASKASVFNVFPVGIAYVAAAMKAAGLDVVTANLEYEDGDTFTALERIIKREGVDVVCTTGLSRDYAKVKEVVDAAKAVKPDVLTVVGGGIITGDAGPAMEAIGCEVGVYGEGEQAMIDLASSIDRHSVFYDIPGAIYPWSDERAVREAGTRLPPDLDSLPFPDYESFAYDKYIAEIGRDRTYLIASRGCPFGCSFCARPGSRKYRQRSLDNVFEELDMLLANYKVPHVILSDELFATKRDRVSEWCRRIKKRGITWAMQMRVPDVDEDMLRECHDAGCLCVSYGIESADQRVLDSMRKKITVAQIEKAMEATRSARLDIQGGFIFGDAAETVETAQNTLDWWKAHRHYGLELNMINIFPGTGLYQEAIRQGKITDPVQYLKDGCPLTNVAKMSDWEYRDLASLVYETNMRAKWGPDVAGVGSVTETGDFDMWWICEVCGEERRAEVDPLHIVRAVCPNCRQRHYIDPFDFVAPYEDGELPVVARFAAFALWGAGELCLKLMERHPAYREGWIVDSSQSRQGYTLCGRPIFDTDVIKRMEIDTVIITVPRRKGEILKSLKAYPLVKRVLVPAVKVVDGRAVLTFEESRNEELRNV